MSRITQERIDLVMRSVSELRETMAEWLNEQIDYEEQRYDSLGRLISTINQTTTRNSGRESTKADNVSTFVGLTIEQVDSLFAVRFSKLESDLKQKEVVVEKKEKTIPTWVGITALLVLIIGLSLFIKKSINL